jgi:UDP-4-amino-4,6-dideoxy-N-acetyl-beta-L-altrosamine N-acetyltransferase
MNNLRDLHPEDKDVIFYWRNLPEVAQYMYTDHEITFAEHENWFAGIFHNDKTRYWIIQCDGEDVGLASISDIDIVNKRCYWAFYIASPNVRGKGVGSYVEYTILEYVFTELGLNKLCCEVLGFNEAVVNMHQKFGFQQEGLFRQHRWKSGAPLDVVCLAILRDEWLAIADQIAEKLRGRNIIQ